MGLEVYGGLVSPFISVVPDPNGSVWNIYPVPTAGFPDAPSRFLFGMVDGVNYLNTTVVYGQRIMFDSNQAVLVTQGNALYYLMDEKVGVAFKENPAIAP